MHRGFSLSVTENVQVEVKWFNPTKGFGFVASPEGDAFVHVSVLDYSIDPEALSEGTILLADISDGHKGKQVARVHKVIGSPPSAKITGTRRGMQSTPVIGTVKWFSRDRGYGFISLDDGGKDVYVNMQAITKAGLDELKEAQRVRFVSIQRDKGPMAENLEILS